MGIWEHGEGELNRRRVQIIFSVLGGLVSEGFTVFSTMAPIIGLGSCPSYRSLKVSVGFSLSRKRIGLF